MFLCQLPARRSQVWGLSPWLQQVRNCCVCVCDHTCCCCCCRHLTYSSCPTAPVKSFSPRYVLASMATSSLSVTLTGSGVLDPTPGTGNLRSIRFENAATCTPGASAASSVVSIPTANLTPSSDFSQLVIAFTGTSGLTGTGAYSICVDFTVFPLSPTYASVGIFYVFVGAYFFSSLSSSTFFCILAHD